MCWFIILVGGALAGNDAINSWACMFGITKAIDMFISESIGVVVIIFYSLKILTLVVNCHL